MINQLSTSVTAKWFRASEASGDFMGIRYGRVQEGRGEVEWHFVSHIECDGIGGFARLLRERGVETGKLPETKHRCRLVLVPLLRLWRECRRQGRCAVRGDWLVPDQGAAGISEAVAWHLFTVQETRGIMERCRERAVTVNSFLLKHLDQAVRPQVIRPEATLPCEVAPPNGASSLLMKWAGREGVSTPKIDREHETKKKTSDRRIQSPSGT